MGKYYRFRQNNSYGRFIINDELAVNVFIKAKNSNEANLKALKAGIYFNGVAEGIDCPCCGDRWCEVDEYDSCDEIDLNDDYLWLWSDYIIVYDETMQPKKIYKPTERSKKNDNC